MKTDKFKSLYTAAIQYPVEVEVSETTKNEAGEEIKITKKVVEKKERTIALRKSNRELADRAEVFFNVCVGQGIKDGLLPFALLKKRIQNDGGDLSEPEHEDYIQTLHVFAEVRDEYVQLSAVKNPTDEQKARIDSLFKINVELTSKIQAIENNRSAIYESSAEYRARSKTIMWWFLHLAYYLKDTEKTRFGTEEEAEWMPLYPGDTYKDKHSLYYEILDNEVVNPEDLSFYNVATDRLLSATAFWYTSANVTRPEDFRSWENYNYPKDIPKEEAVKVEEPKVEDEPETPAEPTAKKKSKAKE